MSHAVVISPVVWDASKLARAEAEQHSAPPSLHHSCLFGLTIKLCRAALTICKPTLFIMYHARYLDIFISIEV
jgi:hypothetical protein